MKLIDLLVKEMPKHGGWPSNADECTQCVIDGEITLHGNCKPRSGIYLALADDWDEVRITRDQYEAALAVSKHPVWNGEGLPPVGTECEAFISAHNRGACFEWRKVRVVHSGDPGSITECIVFDIESTMPTWADEFRHISTRAEAERKREEAKNVIAELCRSSSSNGHSADLIYDAIAAGKILGIKLE